MQKLQIVSRCRNQKQVMSNKPKGKDKEKPKSPSGYKPGY